MPSSPTFPLLQGSGFESLAGIRFSPIGSDFAFSLQLSGGFTPFTTNLAAPLPARVRVGPDGFLYIVDKGDESGQISTGQVIQMDRGRNLNPQRMH